MSLWKKSGEYLSPADVIIKKSGVGASELLEPTPNHIIENMERAEELIRRMAVRERKPVVIIGDYDADGITATAILVKLFSYLRVQHRVIIPRRFSDGYGISRRMVEQLHGSLIITVDNGIAAVEEIALAKQNGNTVLILDHHQPGPQLPCADLIVDPHLHPERNGFTGYCGAGLAYKLAQRFISDQRADGPDALWRAITVLAAIGTVADVVPLLGDNRKIVLDAFEILNSDFRYKLPAGIRCVLDLAGEVMTEDVIGFTIAPLLNAPGRLHDHGGLSILKLLISTDSDAAYSKSARLKEINETRKQVVATWSKIVMSKAEQQRGKCPVIVYQKGVPQGIIGILTGKIAEQLGTPAFVFTQAQSGTPVKGSGRSCNGFDLNKILESIRGIAESAGGHQGAAGITVAPDRYIELAKAMRACPAAQEYVPDDSVSFDLEIPAIRVAEVLEEIRPYTPFGAGVPRPVFVIKGFCLAENHGREIFFMGKEKEHVKLSGMDTTAVCFHLAKKYEELGSPRSLDLLGTIDENTYNGKTTKQIHVIDFKPVK